MDFAKQNQERLAQEQVAIEKFNKHVATTVADLTMGGYDSVAQDVDLFADSLTYDFRRGVMAESEMYEWLNAKVERETNQTKPNQTKGNIMLNALKQLAKTEVAFRKIQNMECELYEQGVLFIDEAMCKLYPQHFMVRREYHRLYKAVREMAQEAVRQYRGTHTNQYDQQHYDHNVNLYEGSLWFNRPVAFTALGYNW